ncbi:serine hydrolase [Streptomyces roseirectus]|uniref:serine hydrolase n=1 Tax=Streptomyces roseirectus TaxID=2768066 RepID=UPI002483CDFF|nr:serine hydrolase domain-containing protein [Streptomyces roseirectus]
MAAGVVRGNGNDGGRVTVRELGRLAMRHPPEFSPPGAGWSCSNTNYVLAAMIVHKVTGRSWARETRDRIIRPLGLRHTSTPGVSASVPLPHAQSYAAFGTDTGTDVTELDAMTTTVAVPELGVKYGHGTRTATVYVASDPGRHTQRAMTTLVGRELCRAAVGPPTPPWRG